MSPEWGKYDQAKADADIAVEAAARAAADGAETAARLTQVSMHAADKAAHIRDLRQVLATGQYHLLSLMPNIGDSSTYTFTANQLIAFPIIIPRKMTFDRIAIQVATADAGKAIRLGIYADGTNLYPGALVLDAGVVDVSSTGVKAITISQQLDKGVYHLAVISDGAPHVYADAITWGPYGLNATNFPQGAGNWVAALSYGALPDPFTAGGGYDAERSPIVALRLLSLD